MYNGDLFLCSEGYWRFHIPIYNGEVSEILVKSMCDISNDFMFLTLFVCRPQGPRGLRCRYTAARLLRSWVRTPPGAWMSVVSVVCCQVEVSATSWSLVQKSPTVVCRVWYRDHKNPREWGGGQGRLGGYRAKRKKNLVHVRALKSLCQINTDSWTRILLNHHFINTVRNSNMFQPLKGHLQGI